MLRPSSRAASARTVRVRAEILDEFYRVALGGIGPLHSVLDVACGIGRHSIELAKRGYLVCRCQAPLQLHDKVTALPWFCL